MFHVPSLAVQTVCESNPFPTVPTSREDEVLVDGRLDPRQDGLLIRHRRKVPRFPPDGKDRVVFENAVDLTVSVPRPSAGRETSDQSVLSQAPLGLIG